MATDTYTVARTLANATLDHASGAVFEKYAVTLLRA